MNGGGHTDGSGPAGTPGSPGSAPAVDPLIGQRVGNFTVDRLIGQGAMGAVYLGVHDTLYRKVAIKVLKPAVAMNDTLVRRFVDEARAVSALGHGGLIQVFDFGTLPDGRFYSMMEYLEGRDLEIEVHEVKRLDPGRAVSIVIQAASAVAAAHRHGIIHRDLKPANLFLVTDEQGDYIKVLDFGIAKLMDVEGVTARTAAGHVVGTPEYMSPEQARANDRVSPRTDVYALGCVLYELITGRPPIMADNIPALLMAQQTETPAPLSARARVPDGLDGVVMRCLAKQPEDRYGSMDELIDALAPFSAEVPPERRSGTGPGASMRIPRRASSRKGSVLAWGALGLVAVLCGVGLALYLGGLGGQGGVAGGDTEVADAEPVAAAPPPDAQPDPAVQAAARGKAIWDQHCASCHGASGDGAGDKAPSGTRPRAFTEIYIVAGALDDMQIQVIRDGVDDRSVDGGWSMPPFGDKLTDAQIRDVVAYVATLSAPAPSPDAMAPRRDKPELTPKLARRGSELYADKCASCHGRRGRGNGRRAKYLKRKPANLTRGVYKLRSTSVDSLPTDADIFRTLTAGMGMAGMPSFARLPEDDRWALVAHLKTLSRKFRRGKPEDPLPVPAQPELTEERVRRGKTAFDYAGCPGCHGDTGLGDGKDAGDLKDANGNPIVPPSFATPELFIGGSSPRDIYRTLMTGMAGTPMPEGSVFFTPDQGWDVVAYIQSLQAR